MMSSHHTTDQVLSRVLVIERFAVGIYSVVTIFDVLLPVFASLKSPVATAKLVNVPHVAFTTHEIVIVHVCHTFRDMPVIEKLFHDKIPVEAVNPVSHAGSVSKIFTPVTLFTQLFP
jgi:CHASE1-domain containing sensor protein